MGNPPWDSHHGQQALSKTAATDLTESSMGLGGDLFVPDTQLDPFQS